MTELLLVFGVILVVGFAIAFFINPSLSLLAFYGVLPLIAFANDPVKISDSSATIAMGGVVSVFVLLVGALYTLTHLGKSILRWPGSVGFICFLIISGISVFNSYDIIEGVKYWIRLLSLFILYILSVNIFNAEKDMSRFTKTLLLGLVIPMVVGFYQLFSGVGVQDMVTEARIPVGPHRIYGTFGIPNVYAAYLALPAFLTATLALEQGLSWAKRLFYGSLAGAIAISLFLTYTRAAWLGVFFGFLYIGLTRYKRVLVILIMVMAIAVMVFTVQQLRMGEIETKKVTASGRITLWASMWPVALNKPFSGYGLANTPALVKKVTGYPNGGQSEYFKCLLESGFPGLVALIFTFASMFKSLFGALKYSRGDPLNEPLLLSIMAYFIASVIIAGFENFVLFDNFFLIPIGFGIGVSNAISKSNSLIKDSGI